MKRLAALILAALLCSLPCLAEAPRSVSYYYRSYCEACSPDEDFAETFRAITGAELTNFSFTGYNVAKTSGQDAFSQACAQYGLDENALPVVIVDDKAYVGAGEMNEALAQDALQWGDARESGILYLYVPACESCARAREALDALPSSVNISRGNIRFDSPVVVQTLDASADPAMADALFDAYAVPDDSRVAPCVFMGEHYLSGADEIADKLERMVLLGWATGGIKRVSISDEAPLTLSLLASLGAGIVAGFNTCALSMLLLFLALILEAGKRVGRLAALFLASKLAAYLLIGFALLRLMQQIDLSLMQPISRIALTVLGGMLIFMNLWDAWQARREAYGKIRNQLPSKLRGSLHKLLRRLTRSSVLAPAVILLGIMVALGEFLCAGQLYLMRLLNSARLAPAKQAVQLVGYCLAFIAPSALICALIVRGRNAARVSELLLRNMSLVKLLTAASMLALVVLAWVV